VLDRDREVFSYTRLQVIQDCRGVPVEEALVINHDVRREHRQPGRDLGRVQVVHGADVLLLEQVLAHGVEVQPAGRRLQQHVDRVAQQ